MFKKAKPSAADTARKVAVGAALAAAAGYLTGILTAPKSGKETRDEIKNSAIRKKTEAEKELKKLHTELTDLIGDVKDKGMTMSAKTSKELEAFVDKAVVAKEKARELLSALHEGDAEDKELQQAIAEANKAIDHLRKFVKK
jgi:gas vesicle protein